MRKLALLLLFPFIALLFQACEGEGDPSVPKTEISCGKDPELCSLAEANNKLGFDLLRRISADKPLNNVFISPTSIGTALSMALNGADQKTKDEMLALLGAGKKTLPELNAAYEKLISSLPSIDPKVKLSLANSIWYRKGFIVESSFLDVNRKSFFSEVRELDFSNPGAPGIINGWVNEKTNKLIPSIIDQIPDNAVMYLINAIYFKGQWTKAFNPKETYETEFSTGNRQSVKVKMMTYNYSYASRPYFETSKFHGTLLPYGDSTYTMTFLLPKENYTVNDILPDLNHSNWLAWANNIKSQEIFFGLPKFKMSYERTLNEDLKALGMKDAFVPGVANFSNINKTQKDLHISGVRHKSFIEVDEAGTKAAAVTSVEVGVTSVPNYPNLVLNRPFLFIISENKTNNILFLGKMMDPSKEQ